MLTPQGILTENQAKPVRDRTTEAGASAERGTFKPEVATGDGIPITLKAMECLVLRVG